MEERFVLQETCRVCVRVRRLRALVERGDQAGVRVDSRVRECDSSLTLAVIRLVFPYPISLGLASVFSSVLVLASALYLFPHSPDSTFAPYLHICSPAALAWALHVDTGWF